MLDSKGELVDIMHAGSLTLQSQNVNDQQRIKKWPEVCPQVPNTSSTKGYCTRSCQCVLYKVEGGHQWGELLLRLTRWTKFFLYYSSLIPSSNKEWWDCMVRLKLLPYSELVCRHLNKRKLYSCRFKSDINALQKCFYCISLFLFSFIIILGCTTYTIQIFWVSCGRLNQCEI